MIKGISKRSVVAVTPGSILWDGGLPGFGLRCRESGARNYFLKYRINGRVRWWTIGAHGAPWTADSARTEALRLLGEVAQGKDPAATRDAGREAPTVKELVARFIKEHCETKNKPRTKEEYERLLDTFIVEPLGSQRVGDVCREDLAKIHDKLRDTPYQANRVIAVTSKLFNWAERRGLRTDGSNPCRHLERYGERKRERFLSEAELAQLGEALRKMEREELISPWIAAAIRLLILTGARRGEILDLRWDEVDLNRAQLSLRDSKTGAKTIYLSPAAKQILSKLPRLDGNPFVIVGQRKGRNLVNMSKAWKELRTEAKLGGTRLHDLRHSYASVGVERGLSLPIIGALLGHTQVSTTARYAHLSANPVRAASDLIGKSIQSAIAPPAPRRKALRAVVRSITRPS